MTPKHYPQFHHTPKNIHFSDPPPPQKKKTSIEIQHFEPQRMVRAYIYVKILECHPWGLELCLPWQCIASIELSLDFFLNLYL